MFEHVELDMEPTQVPVTPRITINNLTRIQPGTKLLELIYLQTVAYPGGMHRMHVHPPPGPCASPPPQPERLVMRKDEAVGNKKKMQACLPAT